MSYGSNTVGWGKGFKIEVKYREFMDKIEEFIKTLEKSAQEAIKDAYMEWGPVLVGYAKMMAPRDTGTLRDKMYWRASAKGITLGSAAHTGERNARKGKGYTSARSFRFYSGFVEKGTKYTRPQPFLRPTIERYWPELFNIYFSALRGRYYANRGRSST
jgi:HK97 gp10 family phage protein